MFVFNRDRAQIVPSHQGDQVLPNNSLLAELLRHARRKRLAVRDVNQSIERTYEQLLSDALRLRKKLRSKLSESVLRQIDEGQEIFIGLLAPGGYEYAVGFMAILALGAVIVPMTVVLPVEEAVDFVHRSNQIAIVTSTSAFKLGTDIQDSVQRTHRKSLEVTDILSFLPGQAMTALEMVISSNRYLDDNAAGAVIFTSGTTGKPKAAVLRRGYFHEASRGVADHYSLEPSDVALHVLPVHHVTGLAINFLPFMMIGACVEFKSGSFDPEWTWKRWRQGGLTVFSGVPTIYMRMMRYYEHKIAKLPPDERDSYDKGAKQLKTLFCGTSALPRPLQDFWTRIREGRLILVRYGSTEVGVAISTRSDSVNVPDGAVGEVQLGCEVKLSEGDEGEILVKSPYMFSKYLFDEKATAEAHNGEGFFRTGDIARREGKFYYIVGRASQDIIKSGGYKISALDIEREVLGLPYISEVMVVGVDDFEFGQKVGAVVTLREDQDRYSAKAQDRRKRLTIDALRNDLSDKLARYKQPTLLRVLEGELPKTASGKVLKKQLGLKLFPSPGYEREPEVQVWNSSKSRL